MATLKYKDDTDRAYGLTGMSVCLCLMDSERFLMHLDLDSEADQGLVFTPDFYQIQNQKLSAKAVWAGNLNHFKLLTGMMISNLMCRALVREGKEITRELSDLVLRNLQTEGAELCSLEADETGRLYTESYNFFHRVFCHPQVGGIVESLVEDLREKRRLEAESVLQILRPLLN